MYVNIPADMLGLQLIEYQTDFSDKESCQKNVKKYLDIFLSASPSVVILNVCYRRSFIKSEFYDTVLYNIVRDEKGEVVFDQNGNAKKQIVEDTYAKPNKYFKTFGGVFRTLLEKGIDIFKMAVDYLHSKGIKVYFSVRLNDMHDHNDKYINNAFSLNHPEFCLKDVALYNFAHQKVQELHVNYIKEMVYNYDIDGVELDFLRGTPYFLGEETDRAQIFNDFMKKVKENVASVNQNAKIAVRTFLSQEINNVAGLDVSSWVANGYVDDITISNYYIPSSFEPNVSEWRQMIEQKNCNKNSYKLLCACDYGAGCSNRKTFTITPEILRGFKKAVLSYGADDIYLFNLAYDDVVNYGKAVKDKSIKSLYQDFAQQGDSRFIHVSGLEFDEGKDFRYPIVLQPNDEYKFQIITDKDKGTGFMFVGLLEDAEISLRKKNDKEILSKTFSVVERPYDQKEYDEKATWINHITEASPIMKKSQGFVVDEKDVYIIKNVGKNCATINYIELLKQTN